MTEFKSELTAISTKHSKSAEMILNTVTKGQSVLDYGCGTGRNLVFINEGININQTHLNYLRNDLNV